MEERIQILDKEADSKTKTGLLFWLIQSVKVSTKHKSRKNWREEHETVKGKEGSLIVGHRREQDAGKCSQAS